MKTISVQIDDAKASLLREKAKQLGLKPDELISATIDDLLSHPEPEFDAAARRVISKNKELYRRLA
jgi:hypothetical protein